MDSGFHIQVNGVDTQFFCPPESRTFVEDLLLGKEYPLSLLPKELNPKVILDVGAYVGGVTLNFHRHFPEAEIYSYEPSQEGFEFLKKNTSRNSKIHIHNYGLNNETKELPLWKGADSPSSIHRWPGTKDNEFETVKMVKASDELVAKNLKNISILKIDTEGCEYWILHDLFINVPDLLVISIFVEYHSAVLREWIVSLLGPQYEINAYKEYSPDSGILLLINKEFLTLLKKK
jgi:FkbM family methyltransferase